MLILLVKSKKTGNNSLLIKADIHARHADVLKLMTIARSVQIETIAIAVDTSAE